jgi:hypothetical protein
MSEETSALALQIAGIRAALAVTEEEHGDRLDKIEEALDAAVAGSPKGPPAVAWSRLTDAERDVQRQVLKAWVTDFLRKWFPMYMTDIPDCICNHPEALYELGNMKSETERLYIPEKPPLLDVLNFFDRWFPGVIRRLTGISRSCAPGSCSVRRGEAPRGNPRE